MARPHLSIHGRWLALLGRWAGRRRSPHRPHGQAAPQAGRYTRACVRACSIAVAGVRHGETTGGSKACMHARASKAAAPCTSERRLLAARPGPHRRPRRGARAAGYVRARCALARAGRVATSRGRPCLLASNAYACTQTARPARCACARPDPPKQRFQVAAAGGASARLSHSVPPARALCSTKKLGAPAPAPAPAPVPACCR